MDKFICLDCHCLGRIFLKAYRAIPVKKGTPLWKKLIKYSWVATSKFNYCDVGERLQEVIEYLRVKTEISLMLMC